MRVLISGGGTGGHIYPALAVARALVDLDPATEILYVGRQGGMEETIVPGAGYRLEGLPMRGLQTEALRNLPLLHHLPRSIGRALGLLQGFDPHVVFGTGGYVVAAVGAAALLARRPLLLQVPDAVPGRTIRILGPRARVVFTAFPETAQRLGGARCELSGTPLRPEVAEVAATRPAVGGPLRHLLVVGGSQGANRLNVALAESLKELMKIDGLRVTHVCGRGDHEWLAGFRAGLSDAAQARYQLHPFHDRLFELYADADLVLSRSGGSAVAEMTAVGLPMILVPYPYAGGHQAFNAEPVARAGGAVVVPDGELSGNRLLTEVRRLAGLDGAARLVRMAGASRAAGKPHAAGTIASAILAL